jgi:hypothetical protein
MNHPAEFSQKPQGSPEVATIHGTNSSGNIPSNSFSVTQRKQKSKALTLIWSISCGRAKNFGNGFSIREL